jgi:hypothetical protein
MAICSTQDNDTMKLLQLQKIGIFFSEGPMKCLTHFPIGNGYMTLAKQCPFKTEHLFNNVFALVQKKGIRLSIEYPDQISQTDTNGSIKVAIPERIIVTDSPFTNYQLYPLTILGINECPFPSLSNKTSTLELAKIIGRDKASLGSDNTVMHQLLFQKDNTLIMITRLNYFEKGRYKPKLACKALCSA